MTTDSDRDEIHATADPDSAVDADPSLTNGEHPAGEFSDSDESPGIPDDLSGSAESSGDGSPASDGAVSDSAADRGDAEDDDAEDQDDDQIIIGRSDDIVTPVDTAGHASDSYGQDGTDDEDLDDDDDDAEDDDDDEVASGVVVTEAAAGPYGQDAVSENEPDDEDGAGSDNVADDVTADAAAGYDGAEYGHAGAASVAEARPVPAPAHARTLADDGLGGNAGLAVDAEQIHQRWAAIQSSFVDDPRQSVTDAAAFLEETTTALVASIKQRESELRGEWDNQSLDTEGLRTMLRRYRAVLDRVSAL